MEKDKEGNKLSKKSLRLSEVLWEKKKNEGIFDRRKLMQLLRRCKKRGKRTTNGKGRKESTKAEIKERSQRRMEQIKVR